MRADKTIKLQVAQEGLVWGAQAATSKADYDRTLNMLESINTRAGQYLKAINPEQWALYPHRCTTPLYGWRTTNFVESEQARALRLKPRKMLPFEFFRAYSKILMSECYKRINQTEVWIECGRVVTPKAEAKLQQELRRISDYTVAFSSSSVSYVSHSSSNLESNIEVKLDPPTCACLTWNQFGLPCRHLLAMLYASGRVDKAIDLFKSWYTVSASAQHLVAFRLPSEDLLVRDQQLQAPPRINQAGRPRKRRIRSKGEKRSRAVYRCRKCGARDGHTKATCRYR